MKKSEVLQREFARLQAKHKRLTPNLIVREATNKRSPLHAAFPRHAWNDKQAGHQYRLGIARELLATYVTIVVNEKRNRITVPMFVRDPSLPSRVQGYIQTREISERKQAEGVIQQEMDRIIGCITRARSIADGLETKHPGIAQRLEFLLEGVMSVRTAMAA